MNENERILDPNSIRGTAFCIRASPPKSYHIKAARIPPRLSAKVRWSPHLDNPKVHLAGKVQKINSTPHFVCRRKNFLLVKHVLHHSYMLISHIDGTQSLSSLRLSNLDRLRLVAAEAQRYASKTFKATTLSRSDQSGIESIEEWDGDADEVRN